MYEHMDNTPMRADASSGKVMDHLVDDLFADQLKPDG